MSLLCVGISYRSAPVGLLERLEPDPGEAAKLYDDLLSDGSVAEAMVLATCNRVEVYAEVDKFHAAVAHVSESLARRSGIPIGELSPHLYVHYEERAVSHLFGVAAGLDSMVVGETQVLGQLRAAYAEARKLRALGRAMPTLISGALRVGRRVHRETGIDRAGQSVVSAGLEVARGRIGELSGCRTLVVGAGSMSALAVASLRRAGVAEITVVNRTAGNAQRLASQYGASAGRLADLPALLEAADLVVCATGATGMVIDAAAVAPVADGRPRFFLDLALPRDVDPGVAALPGVTLIDLEGLRGAGGAEETDVAAARLLVAEEVTALLGARRSARVAPTVAALRAKAEDVVAAELLRLSGRLPDLDPAARAEVALTVHRVVDKLLHAPTVRVKELAGVPGGDSYAAALRELFDLDPGAADAVSRPELQVSP
jgi:glutamyl-tRNA reductase